MDPIVPPPFSRTFFVSHDIYRSSDYPRGHPLSIPRVSAVTDLLTCLGWLDEIVPSPMVSEAQLRRFHDGGYLAALAAAEASGVATAEARRRYHIGSANNPPFPKFYSRARITCGGSRHAAELVRDGGLAFNPAGGTHHGRPARASGFCYLNDPVMAILGLLDQGLERVYYVDIDAHHGDGVEDAFADDPRILFASVHEAGRWPHTGIRSTARARNIQVPRGFNDSEMAAVTDRLLTPLGAAFRPQALVVTCGADALADDPLAKLSLSNRALWRTVSRLLPLAPRVILLGGGGYNPWSVSRCWAGLWGLATGRDLDRPLPPAAQSLMRSLFWHADDEDRRPERWYVSLADPPNDGVVRPEVWAAIKEASCATATA